VKIIIDKDIPFIRGLFEPCAETLYLPCAEIVSKNVKDADALIIRTRTQCNRELLADSKVSFIASATIGYDHIDVELCREKGIAWNNAPGCNARAVSQYVISALLHIAETRSHNLKEKFLGIVGAGAVGSQVELAAQALGMSVILNDPPLEQNNRSGKYTNLDTLLKNADYVSLHVPLTSSGAYPTRHLAGFDFFDKLKSGAIFINSSRGEIVDESALKYALKSKRTDGAVLDVWQGEPSIDQELVKLVDLATFHIAGYSVQGKMNAAAMAANSVIEHFNLPLKSLETTSLQASEHREININARNNSLQNIITSAMLATYEIERDSALLKNSPSAFEQLRNTYNYRHEPASYSLKLNGCNDDSLIESLKKLGFILNAN
jgi:erythronate-4-phosphate dehydrogenase